MDLDGLFWIALIVFYFLTRALGGSNRKQQRRAPQQKPPSGGSSDSARGDELEVALDEIREALGFPKQEREPRPEPAPPVAAEEPVPLSERPQRDLERERSKAALEARAEAARKAESRLGGRFQQPGRGPIDVPAPSDGPGKIPVGRGLPPRGQSGLGRPISARRTEPHAALPSFQEEDTFERIGPHAHAPAVVPAKPLSPYETPARKKTRRLRGRLASSAALADAILMKEILDRPLSLRKRQGR